MFSSHSRTRGVTLVEVMVAIGLVAVSLMLVLSLIPAGIHSAQRSEDIQAAAAWSRQLLEDAPVPETFPIPADIAQTQHTLKIGRTNYTATRRLFTQPGEHFLYHVEVVMTWDPEARPLTMTLTKYNPAGPEP